MSDPREVFLHELGDVLYAERTLVKALPTLQEEASDEELVQPASSLSRSSTTARGRSQRQVTTATVW
jgi:ferritin-like metal-binding protein YciE